MEITNKTTTLDPIPTPKFTWNLHKNFPDVKDRAHFLSQVSAEGKIDQMRDLEAEKEFRAHSTHEYEKR